MFRGANQKFPVSFCRRIKEVALRSNEKPPMTEANKKGHYSRAMRSSNLFSGNLHARTCLCLTRPSPAHYRIIPHFHFPYAFFYYFNKQAWLGFMLMLAAALTTQLKSFNTASSPISPTPCYGHCPFCLVLVLVLCSH